MIRIFIHNNKIINVDNEIDAEKLLIDPITDRELTPGEIDNIFGDFAHMAGSPLTTIVDGEIVFDQVTAAEIVQRINLKQQNIQDIEEEKELSGLKNITIDQAHAKIDQIFENAATVEQVKSATVLALKKMMPYILK